ncbi:MAG: hypothetical protein HOY79_32790 [Streptomyces sp.]|nr:hypothetical protein [Streptomyces sp.]
MNLTTREEGGRCSGVASAHGGTGERQVGRQLAEVHVGNHQRDRAVGALLDAEAGEPAVEEGVSSFSAAAPG